MATVEEARMVLWEAVLEIERDCDYVLEPQLDTMIGNLISAVDADAFARGTVKGAEEEKEGIRKNSQLITNAAYSWNFGDPFYIVDVDVLDFTKEVV